MSEVASETLRCILGHSFSKVAWLGEVHCIENTQRAMRALRKHGEYLGHELLDLLGYLIILGIRRKLLEGVSKFAKFGSGNWLHSLVIELASSALADMAAQHLSTVVSPSGNSHGYKGLINQSLDLRTNLHFGRC